jgi:hypothetical protein
MLAAIYELNSAVLAAMPPALTSGSRKYAAERRHLVVRLLTS